MPKQLPSDYFCAAGPNHISWIHTNPFTGSLLLAIFLSEKLIHIIRDLISYDVRGGSG
jgi:hypothetical protein